MSDSLQPHGLQPTRLLFMGFSRHEYWSGLPRPPPGDLLNPGIKPVSLMSPALAAGLLTTSATWEAPRKTCSDLHWSILNMDTPKLKYAPSEVACFPTWGDNWGNALNITVAIQKFWVRR